MDELTGIQSRIVDAYIASDSNKNEAGKLLGKTPQYIGQVLKTPKVAKALAFREDRAMLFVKGAMNDPVITKQEIARMFVEIAKAGMERGFDKEGNSIMLNPGSANTALGHVNQMYAYNAPTETIETKVTRTELEISTSIQSLQAELGELIDMDAEEIPTGESS